MLEARGSPLLDECAFAVVDVSADQDVTVFFENRPVAGRAGSGRSAIVAGLQPYAANRIAIDLDALPIDTLVTAAEQVVVPGYRQAVRVSFGGPAARPLTLRLVDAMNQARILAVENSRGHEEMKRREIERLREGDGELVGRTRM